MFCLVYLIFCVQDKQPPKKVKREFGWLTAGLFFAVSGAASGAGVSAVVGVYKVWVHGS